MHTRFSAQQLAQPALAEAERVIKSCVRHGFCPQTCPTYVLLGDENDSPRGRIDLMRAMLERGGAPDAKTVAHIDRCLSCLSCETTCAARVEYRSLIDCGRAYIETHFRRPLAERLLRAAIVAVLTYPRRLRVALELARIARPFARLLPGRLAQMLALLPATTRDGRSREHGHFEGVRRHRVALLAGCVQQVMGAQVNDATLRVLRRHGCEVVVVGGEECCGALSLHMGRETEALTRARGLLANLMHEINGAGLDAIVINISGCGTTLKDYAHLFAGDARVRDDAAQAAALVRDVSEWLVKLGLQANGTVPALPIAYHDACSLQHGQRVTAAPRQLLRQAGFDVREIPERHFCCGSAGTYNLLQPVLATQLGERKARAAAASGAVAVAAGNLGCMVQIGHHSALPLVHTIELLDWASGGPQPAALAGLDLARYPARAAVPKPVAAGVEEEINFWIYAG